MLRPLGRWFGSPELKIDEPISALDDWALREELPPRDPVASWLHDFAGELPDAVVVDAVLRLDSHDLLEAIPQPVHEPAPIPTTSVVAAATGVQPFAEPAFAPFAEPAFAPFGTDEGLAVPVLTTGTGRAWLGIVAGGIAIVCAVIGIFASG